MIRPTIKLADGHSAVARGVRVKAGKSAVGLPQKHLAQDKKGEPAFDQRNSLVHYWFFYWGGGRSCVDAVRRIRGSL